LSTAQQMRRWFIWSEPDFPRTPTHKVRKNLVKQVVAAEGQQAATTPPQAQPLHALIASLSGQATEANATLKLDSLGRVELASALEDRFQIEVDEAAITVDTTLADLEKLIQTSAAPRAQTAQAAQSYPYPRWALRAPVRWWRLLWYYVLLLPLTRLLCWVKVRQRERLAELHEPALFIANHISMVDHGLILSALPWRFRHRLAIAMGGERLRGMGHPAKDVNWLERVWLRLQYLLVVTLFNVFPLPQKSGFRRSFAHAGEAVDRGYSVLVFPEGRTTQDGALLPFMPGIGMLAAQLNVPVVPIKIEGLFELKQRNRHWAWPGTVKLTFGKPLRFERDAEPTAITQALEERMRDEG
jgi:long-chain acyl-CoA synthetase